MKAVIALVSAASLALLAALPARATEETMTLGRFGKVSLYYASPQPSQVVLFVSGDGGWNLGVVDMARELVTLDAAVAGVDITHYLAALESSDGACLYPAADFEMLAKAVEQHLGYTRYVTPILAGYSSGATLAYAMLVQAPPVTFAGAISLGFCPDLPLKRPLCRGEGLEWEPGPPRGKGVSFLPAKNLQRPWIALQGDIDQVCDARSTREYVARVPMGELVMLPRVGHGYSVPRNWMPQFRAAFAGVVTRKAPEFSARSDELKDLPLEEFPVAPDSARAGSARNTMALLISGDGGYGQTERGISRLLAGAGIPVVGLNTLQYFWSERSPEETATDVARILHHFLEAWGTERVILVGYSFGADVMPFILNRLPADLAPRVSLLALIGPERDAVFKFHITDWFSNREHAGALPVLPELEKLRGTPVLCFHGSEEKDSLCPSCPPGLVNDITVEGGHRVHGRFEPIATAILKAAQ